MVRLAARAWAMGLAPGGLGGGLGSDGPLSAARAVGAEVGLWGRGRVRVAEVWGGVLTLYGVASRGVRKGRFEGWIGENSSCGRLARRAAILGGR